ncbi:MAG: tRNA lysidine(34) synthetase TilS [Deferribacterales bacterium]
MKEMVKGSKNTLLEHKLSANLSALNGKRLLIAFSGGRDSVALLHFFCKYAERYGITVAACHVNHGIRGRYGVRDEEFCREFCRELGVVLYVERIDVPKYVRENNISVEDAARRLRYEALNNIKNAYKFDFIVTAHHLDDMVENFFIKSFLGTSIENLRGFSIDEGLLRPFIGLYREELEEYLKFYGLNYVDDETNFSSQYVRNWVRLNIIPEIKKYNENYLKNIASLQEQSNELKNYLKSRIKFDLVKNKDYAEMEASSLKERDIFEKKYILNKMFEGFFRVERKHIDYAISNLDGNSVRVNMPNDFIFEVSFNKVRLFKKGMVEGYKFVKKITDDIVILSKMCKYIKFDGWYKDKELIIRNRREGDRLKGKKLKDIMIDKKIDLFERDRLVVVEYNNEIVWVERIFEDDKNIQIYEMGV